MKLARTLVISALFILGWNLETSATPPPAEIKGRVLARILSKLPDYINYAESNSKELCIIRDEELYNLLRLNIRNDLGFRFISTLADQDIAHCSLLYASDAKIARAALIRNKALFIVSNYPRFVDEGGPAALVENDGRIEIHLNLTAAKERKARFNPDLIEISKRVIQ